MRGLWMHEYIGCKYNMYHEALTNNEDESKFNVVGKMSGFFLKITLILRELFWFLGRNANFI